MEAKEVYRRYVDGTGGHGISGDITTDVLVTTYLFASIMLLNRVIWYVNARNSSESMRSQVFPVIGMLTSLGVRV